MKKAFLTLGAILVFGIASAQTKDTTATGNSSAKKARSERTTVTTTKETRKSNTYQEPATVPGTSQSKAKKMTSPTTNPPAPTSPPPTVPATTTPQTGNPNPTNP